VCSQRSACRWGLPVRVVGGAIAGGRTVRSKGAQPAEHLLVAEQPQTSPKDRVVGCLTGVAGDGSTLFGPVDGDPEVDAALFAADEGALVLGVQRLADCLREAPARTGRLGAPARAAWVARQWSE
jgi:hypothetical protein